MSLQSRLSALITAIGADIKALKQQSSSMVRVRRASGPVTINNTTVTVVSWDTEETDTPGGMWSSGALSKLYAIQSGPHTIVGQVGWPSGAAAGSREVWIMKNGSTGDRLGDEVEVPGQSGDVRRTRVSTVVWLNAGDYVELALYQSSGGPLTMEVGQPFHMAMSCAVGSKGDTGPTGPQGTSGVIDVSSVNVWQASATTTYPSGTPTPVTFDSETDPKGMHASGDSKLYAVVAGKHAVVAGVQPSAGGLTLGLRKNGDDAQIQWHVRGAQDFRAGGSWQVDLLVGEYVEVLISSGVSGGTTVAGKGNTYAHMTALLGAKGDIGPSGNYLPATPPSTSPADNQKVTWTRTGDGALVAEINAKTSANGAQKMGSMEIFAYGQPGDKAQVQEAAIQSDGTLADLYIQNAPYIATKKRRVVVEMHSDDGATFLQRALLYSDGTSDYKREITSVTQLPSSPYDGQEVYLNVWSIMGDVIWHLRYTSWAAGTHKWLPVGGPSPARKVVGTSDVTRTTTNTAFGELTSQTAVLSMLAPAAGNYEVEWGCAAWWNDTANGYVAAACGIGAFTTIPTNSRMRAHFNASAAGFTEYDVSGYAVLSDVAKDDEIRIRFTRRGATGTANVQEPLWMSIKPLQLSRLVV